jgi:hypothetical protein
MPFDSINSKQTSARPRISVVAVMCLSPVKILTGAAISVVLERRAAPDTSRLELFSCHWNRQNHADRAGRTRGGWYLLEQSR